MAIGKPAVASPPLRSGEEEDAVMENEAPRASAAPAVMDGADEDDDVLITGCFDAAGERMWEL